jgi:hypothetical protein
MSLLLSLTSSQMAGPPAAAPSIDSLSSLILTLVGSAFVIVIVVRMFTAYAKKNWGELITELVAVLFVGWFVWDSASAITTLKGIVTGIFG